MRHEWATRDIATNLVHGAWAHDAILALAATVGDDVIATVFMINGRGDLVGVLYATDLLDVSARLQPSRKQR